MKNIGIVGYVDHENTTVTSAITKVLQARVEDATVIEQYFQSERGIKITNPYVFEGVNVWVNKKESRRERRKNQRKNKTQKHNEKFKQSYKNYITSI